MYALYRSLALFNSMNILRQRKRHLSKEVHGMIPLIAARLELSLYCSASSFEEYTDDSKLAMRLQEVVLEMKFHRDLKRLTLARKQDNISKKDDTCLPAKRSGSKHPKWILRDRRRNASKENTSVGTKERQC
mmetsp:Transcript_21966/g.50687  ORF Transcript_21966/g.50687 Transcript_21966/m.50687 type:complete len:132 (+) Transcript_21966:232-627(+)